MFPSCAQSLENSVLLHPQVWAFNFSFLILEILNGIPIGLKTTGTVNRLERLTELPAEFGRSVSQKSLRKNI